MTSSILLSRVFLAEIVVARKTTEEIIIRASIMLIVLSKINRMGRDITKYASGKFIGSAFSSNLMPLFRIAKSGIMSKVITADPPIKFPTDMPGVLSMIEKYATEISLTEVRNPNAKKETKKDDI